MTTTESFSVRAEPQLLQRLDMLAESMERSRNYLVNQALVEYLETQAWQLEKVQEGITAADKGDFAAPAKVTRVFGKYKTEKSKK